MHRKLKVFFVFAVVLLVVYAAGVMLFWNRFSLRVTVNGDSIALQSAEEVTLNRMVETRNMHLSLHTKDGTQESVSFGELGVYRESDNAFVGQALPSWSWLIDIWKRVDYELPENLFYDRDAVYDAICGLPIVVDGSDDVPSDVVFVEEDGGFELVQGNDGHRIDTKRLLDVVCDHLERFDFTIDLEGEGCYVKSGELDDGSCVPSEVQDLDSVRGSSVVVHMGGDVYETVPDSMVDASVYVEDGVVKIRPSVVMGYVDALAEKYDTVGIVRTFRTSSGGIVQMVPKVSDTFVGYELDREVLLCSVVGALSHGKDVMFDAPWKSIGMSLEGSDIGRTYIEVSIDEQHMWYYRNGDLVVDTDVVTGMDAEGRRTPVGMFSVMSLDTDYTMYYQDGSANAAYFMKVTGDGVGIHDSGWRSCYGGSIYRTDGSHGCVNAPCESVEEIFESLGELPNYHIPVVVY